MRRPTSVLAPVLLAAGLALAAGPPAAPTAADVGKVLRAGAIALSSPVVAGSPSAPALSQATTATQDATVTIRVYGSSGERYDASARSGASCPDCALVACGPILVQFAPKATPAPEGDARSTYRILHDHYGCD